MPPSDSTPTSVVPPPMSTTMEPVGSVTGRPAPIAAAIGSSISQTLRAPALSAASRIARRSTGVEPDGTQMIICGLAKRRRLCTLRMKCLIISSATSKSAMTPSRKGRMAVMLAGVRPSISFASSPTASTCLRPLYWAMATTDGSFNTMPRPLTYTSVFAVPRSMAISADGMPRSLRSIIRPRCYKKTSPSLAPTVVASYRWPKKQRPELAYGQLLLTVDADVFSPRAHFLFPQADRVLLAAFWAGDTEAVGRHALFHWLLDRPMVGAAGAGVDPVAAGGPIQSA